MKYNTTLKRKRLFEQLTVALEYPLSLVVAPMGYGKTTVVEDYLTTHSIEPLWFNFEMPESSPSYIWDTLARQLKSTNAELAVLLGIMGFPYTTPQRNQVFQLIESYTADKIIYIVIDDYQFNQSSQFDGFIKALIRANVRGLRLLILSRTTPELNVTELQLKNKCYRITEKYFTLTRSEVGKIFRLQKVAAENHIIEKTYELSEGWVSAVLLLVQRYKETGAVDSVEDIETLIETTIMKNFESEKDEIAVLGILDSFSSDQLSKILGETVADALISKLLKKGAFIRYNEKNKRYAIHNIFTNYLYEREFVNLDKTQQKLYYKHAGQWFSENDYIIEGIRCYLEAEEYELILKEFQKQSVDKIFDYYPHYVNEIMNQVPDHLIYQYPLAYISYLHFLITAHDINYGIKLLFEMDNYIKQDPNNVLYENLKIKGELEFLKGLISYNDVEKMFKHQKLAYEIIAGPSLTTRPDKMPCAGSYSVLYMYYKEVGSLKKITQLINENIYYYDHLSNRIGTGIDYLVFAEYYLEIGEIEEAELYAKKGLIKSSQLPQVDVITCCNYILARCKLAKADVQGSLNIMNSIIKDCSYELRSLFQSVKSSYFFARDSIYLKTIQLESVSESIKNQTFNEKVLFFQSRGLGYILHGQCLMYQKKYIELDVFCETLKQQFEPFNNLLGYINANILESIAVYNLYGVGQAKISLETALSTAYSDDIVTTIVEYGCELLPLLEAYSLTVNFEETLYTENYFNTLLNRTNDYAQCISYFQKDDKMVILTSRENDVMALLCTGKKNIVIASELYVSESAVKKMLSSIYRKYNVSNRTAAIKIYKE